MKLSGTEKAFFIAAILALPVVEAQQADTEPALILQEQAQEQDSAAEAEEPGAVRVLHVERPLELATLADTDPLDLFPPALPAPVDEVSLLYADLSSEQQEYLRRLQDIEDYEQTLEQLEVDGGAWSVQIAEELEMLGSLLQAQGDYEESLTIFDRAVHIRRVNYGLFSPEQIPLIERVVSNHVALGQWEEADEQQQYAFYVQTRAYGPQDPRMISVFQNLARWNITSFYRGIDLDPRARLLQTFQLYRAAANTVAAHFGKDDPRYLELLHDVAGASDMLSRYGVESEYVSTPINPNIRLVTDFSGGPKGPQNTGAGGEYALRGIIEHYSDPDLPATQETLLQRAGAIAGLGDWYLLRDRRQAAMRTYRDAYEFLLAADNGDELARSMFDRIQFLPTFSTFDEEKKEALQLNPDSGARQGYIDLVFDVNQYGRTGNIEVLAIEPPGLERVDIQIINMLRLAQVRPRISDGRSVSSEGERYRFPFWY